MAKIMVIDDEHDNLRNLHLILSSSGYDVSIFDNGKTALCQIEKNKPDLILCDIMMPIIDGYKIKNRLAENPSTKLIPFIFLTSKTEAEDIRKGLKLGADDYLLKPLKTIELLETLKLRINKYEEIKSSANQSNTIENKSEKISIRVGNKNQILQISEILYIEADNQYAIISTSNNKFKLAKSLTYFEQILPSATFLRIHRSTIVNMNKVEKIIDESSNRQKIILTENKKELFVSQRYSKSVRNYLHQL